ncbi:MAG: V-type ATP synthase subunit F [Synergistaceae bacterium]|jgi:V/A-type H+-transporting ATPase subunit F|nr:V-type ATP synthase subunit F [Synergistaceae bacterium]
MEGKSSSAMGMAAVGDYEMVLPFQAVGVTPVVLDEGSRGDFAKVLDGLARENYAVVFVQEDLFVDFTKDVERVTDEYATSVLPVPGVLGGSGAGLESIRSSVEKAVGMDIFAER